MNIWPVWGFPRAVGPRSAVRPPFLPLLRVVRAPPQAGTTQRGSTCRSVAKRTERWRAPARKGCGAGTRWRTLGKGAASLGTGGVRMALGVGSVREGRGDTEMLRVAGSAGYKCWKWREHRECVAHLTIRASLLSIYLSVYLSVCVSACRVRVCCFRVCCWSTSARGKGERARARAGFACSVPVVGVLPAFGRSVATLARQRGDPLPEQRCRCWCRY